MNKKVGVRIKFTEACGFEGGHRSMEVCQVIALLNTIINPVTASLCISTPKKVDGHDGVWGYVPLASIESVLISFENEGSV